jgi:glycosyltransferase involved in cell wall biosynthesis
MKVLFLARWYPNKYDSMNGLFIERHAIAVAEYCDTSVLYIQPDDQCKNKYNYEFESDRNIKVLRVYYKKPEENLLGIDKIINLIRYLKSSYSGFFLLEKECGKPDIIHVNVLTRTGILALYLNKVKGIPYIITEHWSRYLSITDTYKGFLRKIFTSYIVKNACSVTTVTNNLKAAMLNHNLKNINYSVIPNVVDTDLFIIGSKINKIEKIIITHISCFEDISKNISGILRVIKNISEVRQDFECRLVGDGIDKLKLENYALELGIKDKFVFFDGLLEGKEIVTALQKTDFLLMFSNYENFPVVISEALSCGLPVIATNVGGIPEHINDNYGMLVNARNEEELFSVIMKMMDNYKNYDIVKLREYAIENFSRKKVAQQFIEIYNHCLS